MKFSVVNIILNRESSDEMRCIYILWLKWVDIMGKARSCIEIFLHHSRDPVSECSIRECYIIAAMVRSLYEWKKTNNNFRGEILNVFYLFLQNYLHPCMVSGLVSTDWKTMITISNTSILRVWDITKKSKDDTYTAKRGGMKNITRM